MKRLFKRKDTRRGKSRIRRRGRWTSFRNTLVGGTIVAGAAMWAVAMMHIAERHL